MKRHSHVPPLSPCFRRGCGATFPSRSTPSVPLCLSRATSFTCPNQLKVRVLLVRTSLERNVLGDVFKARSSFSVGPSHAQAVAFT